MKPKIIRITTVPISLKILLKGQHRFFKSKGFDVIGVSSPGKDLDQVKNTEGIPIIALEMSRKISFFKDIKSLWLFYIICIKERPHIVHSHTPKAGIVGMLGAKLAGVPIRLHTVAGMPLMETTGIKRKVLNFIEKLTYSCANKVYPNSKGLHDFILENNFTSKSKLKVIAEGSSNGINTNFFSLCALGEFDLEKLKFSLGISSEDFVFVFVGRLVGDKGINELIEAFVKLNSKNVKLLLVGSLEQDLDPLKTETLNEIESNSNIISVGFQQDVRPYFAISDCLVFPSYREGFPNVVMQAGAMGLPSIVSNINGCNEIIVEGENGTIIPAKCESSLYDSMFKMLENRGYYNHLKSNARAMITSRYEQEVVWKALHEEYKVLLKDKGLAYV